jgi:hypothetical protein
MSRKREILRIELVAAINALDGIRCAIETDAANGKRNLWYGEYFGAMLKPFDLLANGCGFSKAVKQSDYLAYMVKWFDLFNWLKVDDNHFDMVLSFVQMVSEAVPVGVFAGVYGVFRVALARCLISRCVEKNGGRNPLEIIKRNSEDVRKIKDDAKLARVYAARQKTRDDYIMLQYQEIKKEVARQTARGERCGVLRYAIDKVRRMKEVTGDNGDIVEIPPDGGLTARDCRGGKYLAIRRWLKADGLW